MQGPKGEEHDYHPWHVTSCSGRKVSAFRRNCLHLQGANSRFLQIISDILRVPAERYQRFGGTASIFREQIVDFSKSLVIFYLFWQKGISVSEELPPSSGSKQ
jgi:hypothetical protein